MYAFACEAGLRQLVIPDCIETIGIAAFEGCTGIESLVIPGSVKTVCEHAFRSCVNLKTVELREGILDFHPYCFNNCTSLTSIVFPQSTVTVRKYALGGCTQLKEISLPGELMYSEYSMLGTVFINDTALETIRYGGTVRDWWVPCRKLFPSLKRSRGSPYPRSYLSRRKNARAADVFSGCGVRHAAGRPFTVGYPIPSRFMTKGARGQRPSSGSLMPLSVPFSGEIRLSKRQVG